MSEEKFTFFWNGPFSQWTSSPFIFSNMHFNCAEQFMMFNKAAFFNDFETATQIMVSKSPSEQKKLGRKVKNFNIDKWTNVAKQIVYVGSYNKYIQNDDLCQTLNLTKGSTLVEASPYDKIWGIGLYENDPKALNRETWNGKNWLGEVLTQVREDMLIGIKNEQAFKLCERLVKKYKRDK